MHWVLALIYCCRLVPVAGLPHKAPPPQMTVNLPPNATQAQRMQVGGVDGEGGGVEEMLCLKDGEAL